MLKEVGASGQSRWARSTPGNCLTCKRGGRQHRDAPVKIVPVTPSVREEPARYDAACLTAAMGSGSTPQVARYNAWAAEREPYSQRVRRWRGRRLSRGAIRHLPQPAGARPARLPLCAGNPGDLLYPFAERVCVPLARPGAFPGMTERFNPAIAVGEQTCTYTTGHCRFPAVELRQSCNSAKAQMLEIETALDMLLRDY
ncbi:MAG: CcdB family protein [Simplicispira sp.]|nr:CcdB family protein [Simplicispira sp.]